MGNEIVNLLSLFSPVTFLYLCMGTFLGIVVGALPGLTATMAVSILISLTYGLSAANAIVVLIAVYLGGIYGGSRSAILLNVPGTPSSAATAIDGFPLTLKGEGGRAGVVVTTFSALGGLFGLVILAVATPLIARFALKFGYWEYFWLAMMGVLISASITTGDAPNYKGIIAGFIGMLVSCIGIDPIHGYPRMVYGYSQMMGGITLVPAMIGLFGMAEAFDAIKNPKSHEVMELKEKESLPAMIVASFKMLVKYPRASIQAGLIGTFIGALPGVGPDIASWVAYGTAKRGSKHPEEYGKGSYEGIIASETANNAATSGVFIPLLTLGIPGCAVSAIILGGMQMHGFRPGPTFFFENPNFVYFIAGTLLMVNIVMWVQGVVLTSVIAKILKAPMGIIMPLVVVLCVVGSYTISLRKFDVVVMLIFGLFGMVMRKLKIPGAPMALGIILGSMADLSFRRGMIAGRFSIGSFFARPLSLILIAILVLSLLIPVINKIRDKHRTRKV